MRRMAMGTVAGVAVWLASAVAAEAQGITPTGPTTLTLLPGARSSTYTANAYLPTPNNFRVRLYVIDLNTGLQIHYSDTLFNNPYTNNTTISIDATHSPLIANHELSYQVGLRVGSGSWIPAGFPTIKIKHEKIKVLSDTRPSKVTSVQKAPKLALQSVERDRRRE